MSQDEQKSQGTTFSSMGDELFDMRFSPDSRKLFEEQVDAIEAITSGRSYDIPVIFFGRFDEKSQKAIKILVNEVIQNANKYELKLQQTDPSVQFYTLSSWEERLGKPYQKNINLPASKIQWENGAPIIQLIIPERVTSSEEVIKTIRLLFSKIYGKLFFDEHVPSKSAFRLLPDEKEAVDIGIKEKVHFCHLISKYPPSLLKEFEKLAVKFSMKGQKAREFGEKEFFKNIDAELEAFEKLAANFDMEEEEVAELREKELDKQPESEVSELSTEHTALIEETFDKNVESLRSEPEDFFDALTEKVFTLIPQSTLLLPYDIQKFKFLRENRQWTIFHALDERLQFVLNIINDLQECRTFLDEKPSDQPLAYQISDLWQKTLHERMVLLKRKGLVKLFLIDGAKLTEKQQNEKREFPFWIWRHDLFKNFPVGTKPEKMVNRITEQYQHSIYQKLFETAFRLIQTIKHLEKDETSTLAQCPDFQTLKNLFVWIELRSPSLEDLLYSCKVGSQLSALVRKKGTTKQEALQNLERGWSYFVSFALVHKYYLNIKQKKKSVDSRAEQFLSVIEKFTRKRLKNQPIYQIANLLIQMYKRRNFDLKLIIPLIVKEAQILDFFVLNLQEIFKNDAKTPELIIDHYSDSVIQWQDQISRHKISQEEIESLSSPEPL